MPSPIRCGLAALVAFAGVLPGQTLNYTGTVFVHGLGDSGSRWTNGILGGSSPINRYNALIELRNVPTPPSLSSTSSIATQRGQLVSFLSSVGGQNVLVGHSMGGIVSRAAYLNTPTNITAIINIASPHNGTLATNNAATFHAYLDKTISRVDQAMTLFGVRLLGPVVGLIGANYVDSKFLKPYKGQLVKQFAVPTSAAGIDLNVGSPALAALQADTRDAVIPRANVVGNIPIRNFPIRLLASSEGTDFNSIVRQRNLLKSALKTCKHLRYGTILGYVGGRKCSLAEKMIARMDGKFLGWTVGTQANGLPRIVPFDGLVAQERANYPGLSLTQNIVSISATSDHTGILADGQSISNAMIRVGMVPH